MNQPTHSYDYPTIGRVYYRKTPNPYGHRSLWEFWDKYTQRWVRSRCHIDEREMRKL